MSTPTHFDSAYNIGDTVYTMLDDGTAAPVQITDVEFRLGYNPLSFNANTDFIYTTNRLSQDGITYIKRQQQYCYATKQLMSAYVLALP